MRAAFAIPGFGRLYAGLTISALGDWMLLLVLGIWVKELTGSSGLAGLTMFFVVAPSLLVPVAGMWIDRVRRKSLLVVGNALSAFVVLPLLLVHDRGHAWVVFAVAAAYGTSAAVLEAGVNGLVKELMPPEHLVTANSAIQSSREALRLVGPLAGAGLYGWLGGGAVALVDALTFVVAALAIAGVAVRQARPERGGQGVWREMSAGVRHIAADRILRHTFTGFGIMLLLLGLAEASIYAVVEAFGRPPSFVAVVVTLQGIGAVCGAVAAAPLLRSAGEVTGLVLAMLGMAAGLTVIAATRSLTVMLIAGGFIGLTIPIMMIAVNTLVQVRTPQAVLGRTSTVLAMLFGGPQALSMAAGAWLVSVLSFRVIFAAMATASLLGAAHIWWWLRDRVRLRPLPPAAQPASAAEQSEAVLQGEDPLD